MTSQQFCLPDLGEGLPDGEIVRWLVAVGDVVTVNQPIVEVETAKAVVEVPSPWAGTVAEVHCDAGATAAVGSPIITIEVPGNGGPAVGGSAGAGEPAGQLNGHRSGGGQRTPVLVGYGPSTGGPRRSRRSRGAAADSVAPAPRGDGSPVRAGAVLAKPPVRKLARDLGVDLAVVAGTGPAGTISRDDVHAAAAHAARGQAGPALAGPAAIGPGLDPPLEGVLDAAARTTRIPISGVRKATARAMVASAFTAPHVTEFLRVDATATVELRDTLAGLPEFADVKVTPLLVVAKALLVAIRRHPMINSHWDEEAGEIVVHGRVNLGIAVATPKGLIVPNIPDADRLALPELARALREVAVTGRDGRTTPAAMRGGTITITNIGVLGVDTGTPILNPGEAAILAVGSIRPMPWVHEGTVAVRSVAQLALSFDHRIVDGQLGSAVLSDVGRMVEDPRLALAWS